MTRPRYGSDLVQQDGGTSIRARSTILAPPGRPRAVPLKSSSSCTRWNIGSPLPNSIASRMRGVHFGRRLDGRRLIGLIAGWLAGTLMKGSAFGVLGDSVIGVIGAFIGGILFRLVGI